MSVYSARLQKLQRLLRELSSTHLLITSPFNVTYLTGFSGEDSFLLVGKTGATILSDARYEEQIAEECPGLEACIRKSTVPILQETVNLLKKHRASSMAIEGDSMTVSQWNQLKELASPLAIEPVAGLVEGLREIKGPEEIDRIKRAIAMAERSFIGLRSRLTPDQTELDLANELDRSIRHLGGKGAAFQTIVGVGPRAALPHGRPTAKRLSESTFVLIDWGANEGQYLSDLTRILVTGRIPAKLSNVYASVLNAHRAAAEALRPGARCCDIDRIARESIESDGFGKRFTHGLGHGFGMQIHESPRFAKTQEKQLQVGMIVTIEPGIYFPGWGGVRLEDDYLITEDGCEKLTSLPQELEANIVTFL